MHAPPAQHAASNEPPTAVSTYASSGRRGGEDGGGGGEGGDEGGGGDGGGGDGASRMTWAWTSVTDGVAGASSMVTPNTLLIASRGFVCKATAADSTSLAPPAVVSVTTTVRITLPAVAVTVSKHAGKEHCSSSRRLASTESATAANSSTVPPTLSTKVTSLAGTNSVTAPGCSGGGKGGGGEGGGLGGGGEPGGNGGSVGGGEAGGRGGGGKPGGNGGGGGAGPEGGGVPINEYTQLTYVETWM
eukprot:scaffold87289_cov60-Phaeocystis_antarctica.AAC.2